MLIGAALGRTGALTDPPAHRCLWRWLLAALPQGLVMSLVVLLSQYGRLGWPTGLQADGAPQVLLRMLNRAAGIVLAVGYMAWFVHLFGLRLWLPLLKPLAPVGRMALSSYLAQTVISIGLFYGVGFGIVSRHGLVGVFAAWAMIFMVQLAVSHWWLARFRFGPAEWSWRSATYGHWQAMRR